MDMWCPYGIGRESWDREVLRIVCSPFPPRGGDLPSGCVSLRGCRRIGAQEIIVVVDDDGDDDDTIVIIIIIVIVIVIIIIIIIVIITIIVMRPEA